MKENRKIKYTKMVIRQSLEELLRHNSLHEITVKELCAQADINRSTFYAHYPTMQNLISEIEKENAKKLISSLHIETYQSGIFQKTAPDAFLTTLFSDQSMQFWLLDPETTGVGKETIHDTALPLFMPLWQANHKVSDCQARLAFEYISGGTFRLLEYWYKNKDAVSEAELRSLYKAMIEKSISIVH